MKHIKTEIDGYIAQVLLDSPPVNAISYDFMEELIATMDEMSDREDVRVVVLASTQKVFSAGIDLKARANRVLKPGDRWKGSRLAREVGYCIIECHKPVISAINGAAVGAGLGLAVASDILFCSEDAFIALPEVDVGLMGGGKHAMRICGHSLTRRMMLTGDRIYGPELYRRGIVEACVPKEQLLPTVMEMAGRIAAKSPLASRMAKLSASSIENMTLRDGYRFEQNLTAQLGESEDAKEAWKAFTEKRTPVFKGR